MDFEVLIINEEIPGYSATRGTVVNAKPVGFVWKPRELTQRFARIAFSGSMHDLAEILNSEYIYDFSAQKFFNTKYNYFFDSNLIDDPSNIVINFTDQIAIAEKVDQNWKNVNPSVCDFLTPSFLEYGPDYKEIREYLLKNMIKVRNLEGMASVIKATRYGNYANIFDAVMLLRPQVRNSLISSFDARGKAWIQNIVGAL